MDNYSSYTYTLFRNVVEEQIVLSDNGISMEFTDTIDSQSRRDLLQILSEWREEHPLNKL